MIEMLRALQALFVCAWTIPIVLFAPQAWRKALSACDQLAAAMWYASISVVAFPVRWLLQGGVLVRMLHDEMAIWAALYVLGIIASVYLTVAVQRVCAGRG